MEYTKDEMKKIKQVYDKVVKDIGAIWLASGQVETRLEINIKGIDKESNKGYDCYSSQILWVNSNEIAIVFTNVSLYNKYLLGRFNRYKKVIPEISSLENIYLVIDFIRAYPTIRKDLISKIKQMQEKNDESDKKNNGKKKKVMDEISLVEKKITQLADIEIDFPPSQNIHKIEIEEVEGRTIGTIDFNGRTIRIITDGDIVLVKKKTEEAKQKRRLKV